MLDYEYQNIIDYFSNQYDIYFSTDRRKSLIKLHKYMERLQDDELVDFERLCEHVMIEEYLSEKYPGLNLYNRVFSEMGMN